MSDELKDAKKQLRGSINGESYNNTLEAKIEVVQEALVAIIDSLLEDYEIEQEFGDDYSGGQEFGNEE
jgi:hypothetical protein